MVENQLPADKKWIYLYDTQKTTHPFQLRLMVKRDDPIMPGQTEVPVPDDNKTYYWNDSTKQWIDSTVMVYGINPDMSFGPMTKRPAGYTLQANETFKKPQDGLYDPTWNGSDWVGISAEEYYKQHPVAPIKPSDQQKVTMAQQADITQLQKMVMSQQSTMTQMQKTIMAQESIITELKKGAN